MQTCKSGWLEKFSVGRGLLPVKNWQRRWFQVDHTGLNYSKAPSDKPSARTRIPFSERIHGASAEGVKQLAADSGLDEKMVIANF